MNLNYTRNSRVKKRKKTVILVLMISMKTRRIFSKMMGNKHLNTQK